MTEQVPFHDQQQVYGVSEDCKFNDHGMCRSPRCGCDCHRRVATKPDTNSGSGSNIPSPAILQTGIDKYCPSCKAKYATDYNYCTVDGSKLSSLRCPECNTPGSDSDNYCGYCGCSMKMGDRQLEEVATGSRVAVDNPEISTVDNDAEAKMREAMASRQPIKKTVPPPSKISIGMFK